jgi:serine protease Do
MKFFAALRIPMLLLGAFSAVAMDRAIRHPVLPGPELAAPPPPAAPRPAARAIPDLLERVAPAVVSIYALKTAAPRNASSLFSPFGTGDDGTHASEPNLGSGVIVRADGFIVTNHHVIEGADEIKVVLSDRREFRAALVGQDPHTDLALLRVEAEGLPAVSLADSNQVRIGESVLSMGNALGLGQTVSSGIVGARGRSGIGIADEEDFIQTDASMNPGSSGGPLLNLKGEVVGINTAIATRTGGFQGIGFVIPSRLVQEIVDRLMKDGRIDRGELGIVVQELTPALAEAFDLERAQGVIVTDVPPQSAAARGGLHRGDVLVAMDGKPVTSRFDLDHRAAMRGARAGVELEVRRGGKTLALKAQLDSMKENPTPAHDAGAQEDPGGQPSGLDGVTVRRVPPETLREAGIKDEEGGLVVTGLQGPGVFAGLRRGDLIVEVNGRPVHEVDEILEGLCLKGSTVLVRVRRPEGSVYLMVPY